MLVQTIQMDPRIARIHYADYRKRCRANRERRKAAAAAEFESTIRKARVELSRMEKEDEQLLQAYRALYRGQQLIDLPKVLAGGGLDSKRLPKLAVIRADVEKCHLAIEGGRVYFLHEHHSYIWKLKQSDGLSFGTPMPRELIDTSWRNSNSYPNRATALVPSIPPQLRPDDLSKYFILWEAEWEAKAPVDPLLLSRVNDTLFAIVAQWDLTPLEQRVLEGRL